MKQNSPLKTIATIIITALITFVVTMFFLYGRIIKTEGGVDVSEALKNDNYKHKLALIQNLIDSQYMGEVDENMVQEYVLKGYVAGLNDVYSTYYTAEELNSIYEEMSSSYVGIGVYITRNTEEDKVEIVGFLKGSPASDSGMKTGDFIVAIDGTKITGEDFSKASSMIKGEEGTNVVLTISRTGEEDKDYTVTRKTIEVNSIEYQMLDNNIGYIYISTFDREKMSTEFAAAYLDLAGKGATSLIVDVRNNGGGIFEESTNICDMFVDPGIKLVHRRDKEGKDLVTISTTQKTIEMNTAILINGESASASELFTGAVRDNKENCVVIGTQSYGKGVVQQLIPLTDGSGVKITTNEYTTTGDYKIQGVGIIPDVKVTGYTYTGTLDKEKDIQLQKAIEILKDGNISNFRSTDRQNLEKYKNTTTGDVVK